MGTFCLLWAFCHDSSGLWVPTCSQTHTTLGMSAPPPWGQLPPPETAPCLQLHPCLPRVWCANTTLDTQDLILSLLHLIGIISAHIWPPVCNDFLMHLHGTSTQKSERGGNGAIDVSNEKGGIIWHNVYCIVFPGPSTAGHWDRLGIRGEKGEGLGLYSGSCLQT